LYGLSESASYLLQACSLADPISQEVEFRAAHFTVPADFDFFDTWRMQAENALYTNAMGSDLANRHACGWSFSLDSNDGTLEYLHALVLSFDDAIMHLDDVAGLDFRCFRFELLIF